MKPWEATRNALERVLEAKPSESIAIFCDDSKLDIGKAFLNGALKLGLKTRFTPLKTEKKVFRREITQQMLETLEQQPSIYINVMRGTREETPFRIKLIQLETREHKSRLGHCPGVTLDMLTDGALALSIKEHKHMQGFAKTLIKQLRKAVRIKVKNPAGTTLSMNVEGRPFFTDTLIDRKTMKWMNLPTGEVIVAPIENSLQGSLVCDMAIGGMGALKTPIVLSVEEGKVEDLSCDDSQVLRRVRDSLNTDANSSRVGEFAFGINPKARFVEEFLEAEKLLGTTHVAFGNNSDFPKGKNPSKNHLDFLFSKPTVEVLSKDGKTLTVLADGVFQKI